MGIKFLGAVLILGSCIGIGSSVVAGYKREENMLRSLMHILSWMECELQYRLTPLPELCRQAAQEVTGALRDVFLCLDHKLEEKNASEASDCMKQILQSRDDIPGKPRKILLLLGRSLGRFDLSGQILELQAVQAACQEAVALMENDSEKSLRSCQTLSLCAGAALVILFI